MKVLRKMTKHGLNHIFARKHFWSKHICVFMSDPFDSRRIKLLKPNTADFSKGQKNSK